MTNNKNEQLLKKLLTIALKIDELLIDNEFQSGPQTVGISAFLVPVFCSLREKG